jgi:redox-sensing transcriptional repressor
MAEFLGVNPWQIRKDFSYFGVFGTAGVGYNIKKLIKQIKKILKLDVVHKAALVGAGNLGSAIMAYPGFGTYGFDIAAAFDTNPKKIGRKVKNITIEDVSINKSKPFLGTAVEHMGLCAPKKSRQQCIKIRPCCRDPSDVRFRRVF